MSNNNAIFLAVLSRGSVHVDWAMNFHAAPRPMGRRQYVTSVQGYSCSHGRNVATTIALQSGAEFLMFWDDDVIPHDTDAYLRLVNDIAQLPDAAAVGGVYPRRVESGEPIVVKEDDGGTWYGWKDGQVHQVHMTGTGFLCLRLSEMEDLAKNLEQYECDDGKKVHIWFNDHNGKTTDDFWLAGLMKNAGKKWYVDGAATCDQMGADGIPYPLDTRQLEAAGV